MNTQLETYIEEVNDWARNHSQKIFTDSQKNPFQILGAKTEYIDQKPKISLLIKDNSASYKMIPLNYLKYNGQDIPPQLLLSILKNQNHFEGKTSWDLTDILKNWHDKNNYKLFTDKSGVKYYISNIKPDGKIEFTSYTGQVFEKNPQSIAINGQFLTKDNAFKLLSGYNSIDTQIYYGDIIKAINDWVKNNDKTFQNGYTGRIKILGAKQQNGVILLTVANENNQKKNINLNHFVWHNQKMKIGNAIEMLNAAVKFDNTFRFGNELEEVNNWLMQNKKAFTDKNGTKFCIDKIFRDEHSQLKFQLTNENNMTVARSVHSFVYGNNTIKEGNILSFLQQTNHFDNTILFENAWQHGVAEKSEKPNHFLPKFDSLKKDDTIRLPNGQCAKIINKNTLIFSTTQRKTIDMVIEDGTIISGVSQSRYESGLYNINTNRPMLNILPLNPIGEHKDADVRKKMSAMAKEHTALGNRSNIEFKYLYYLQKFGFQVSKPDFFKNYFHMDERRTPDSYMIKDGKMVIFEFDGGGGHGGVYHNLTDDIARDVDKNNMYRNIIQQAQEGEYLPSISDVTVVRIRGNNVPLLNPNNIIELGYDHCNSDEEKIPEIIQEMVTKIDKQISLGLEKQFSDIYPNGIDIEKERNSMNEFVDTMLGKKDKIDDLRIGEISQTIGFGNEQHRYGQYMMIQKVEAKSPGQCLPDDKVTIIFEDGRKTKTSYEKFKNGTVCNKKFNKILDYSTKKMTYTTLGETVKRPYQYSIGYTGNGKEIEQIQLDAEITLDEIRKTKVKYPVVNGQIINITPKPHQKVMSLSEMLKKAKLQNKESNKDISKSKDCNEER